MLRPTFQPTRALDYREPGGAWDQPSLDAQISHAFASLSTESETIAAAEIARRVARAAGALRARGVEPGDAVAWQLPNTIDAAVRLRACWRIGALAVPIHHAFGPADAARVVATTTPRIVLDPDDALDDGAAIDEPWTDGNALGAVLFTSGSSGAPKGVLHSQHTLAYKARVMAVTHGLGPDDCVLMPAPIAHISGLLNGVTLPGVVPFRSVLMARWDPERALALIEQHRVTFMVGPPTFFVALMQAPGFSADRVASLRLVSSGGAGVSEAFVEEASARLGCVVKRTYGSTEAPTVATSRPDDPARAARSHDGRAIADVELTLDARGELLVRGPEVCLGYVDAAQNGEAFDADGWFHTGDLAAIDATGWLTITGRIKDVIIRGGENISATEIEHALEAHDAVHAAVCVGYPDALMGERVCAFVVVEAGSAFDLDACRAWFVARGIAKYKTPERIDVLDALPMLSTGKPDRAALRTRAGRGVV